MRALSKRRAANAPATSAGAAWRVCPRSVTIHRPGRAFAFASEHIALVLELFRLFAKYTYYGEIIDSELLRGSMPTWFGRRDRSRSSSTRTGSAVAGNAKARADRSAANAPASGTRNGRSCPP